MLVFFMGIALIAGAALLGGLAWMKASAEMRACPGGNANLKGHGILIHSAAEGKLLRLILEKHPGSLETVTLDLCTGKILGSVTVETDASAWAP